MNKTYDIFGPIVVNYWKDCLSGWQINPDKINESDLTEWINTMESLVMDNLCDTIPDEWYPEDDEDEDGGEWEDLPDHDDEED
jgi:hypothetical protein